MKKVAKYFLGFLFIFAFSSCEGLLDHLDELEPSEPVVKDFATGLNSPLALELDPYHKLWVTEAGTGNNDGKVSVITPGGKAFPAIEGFISVVDPEGNPSGLNHLLWDDGTLWILHGAEGRLYWADMDNYRPGDAPLHASDLDYQEINDFVYGEGFVESNLYDLTVGPEGDLFMTDAAANAIIRRDAQTSALSIFALFPPVENTTIIGPPFIDAVPTGIIFNENRFLVSTLTGFPFLEGEAKVYEVGLDGTLSVFQDGLTTLVDVELMSNKRPVVLQFSEFGEMGWVPETGKIIQLVNGQNNVLHSGLSFASDMELLGSRIAFVTNLAEGKVIRIRF